MRKSYRIITFICTLFVLIFFTFSVRGSNILAGIYHTDAYFPSLTGKRVAIVANHTSIIGNTHLVDTLLSKGIRVVKIFSPEHGFRGIAEAGENIRNETDKRTGLKIISLYGKHYKPTSSDLHDIDIMLFDIQDVGVRCYTYLSTLHYVMEACAENNISLIVLDRPNPNGFYIDGPVLETKYRSFVGLHPVPLVYGMTIGEYALMINGESWLRNGIRCNLQVITCTNYSHSQKVSLNVRPSPNLWNMQSIYLYPSLTLFEGTSISVGRGTELPFCCFGHPLLDTGNFLFTPKAANRNNAIPYVDTVCRGFNLLNYTLPDTGNLFTLKWLIMAYQHFPLKNKFFNSFFYNLSGTETLRKQIEAGLSETEIRKSWQQNLDSFKKIRKKYLLYP
jgi:uncharacterized protein YbbC (DUF1343 family)